jgi:NAD+ diphosphatase
MDTIALRRVHADAACHCTATLDGRSGATVLHVPRLTKLALARSALDRATERRRDPAWVDACWADERCRVLLVSDGRVPVDDDVTVLRLSSPKDLGATPPAERYLLGLDDDGVPYFAVPGEAEGRLVSLREAGTLLSDRDVGLVVHAIALANWHSTHPCCARCGAETIPSDGGHVRRCPACRAEHFPRTDPAIIVLVHDDADRCLLGRQPSWPVGRFSTLAGFVEPGEPLEHAVIREVREETGIEIVDPSYAGSQPWPFPSSLMLGFFARAVTTEIRVDGDEIAEARWLSRDELLQAVQSGELLLPGKVSIARRLIETWYGGELPGDW